MEVDINELMGALSFSFISPTTRYLHLTEVLATVKSEINMLTSAGLFSYSVYSHTAADRLPFYEHCNAQVEKADDIFFV